MGDAQSAQRDGTSEAAAEEQNAVQDGPSGDSTPDKLVQNNGQISDINGKSDETITEVNDHCEDKVSHEAITVEGKVTSVTKSEPEDVQIIQETLSDANEEEPIEIINVDTKQNDLNESFRKFFSNIGLKLTVKRGAADQADDEGEKEVEKLDVVEETASETKYEDIEQNTDLNAIQDNDSTTCPTLTDETPEDVFETGEGIMTETNEIAVNVTVQEANVSVNEHDENQNQDAAHDESPHNQEGEEFASPIKKFFSTGIFAGLAKKKKEEESLDKELVDISKKEAIEEQQEIGEASPNVAEQEEIGCKDVHAEEVQKMAAPEENVRGKSPSTDQDSESEMTSSQEKAQSSPFKRLFSGSFKRRSKRQKRRKSSDVKLSDSGEHIENEIVVSSEKTEQQVKAAESPSPVPPPTTEPEEELSAWEAFKKLMTPRKSLKRGSEEMQVPAATVEETTPSEGERVSDQSTEEGRKRKDSSHSWEAVLCGSGRRRSRKTSDSEDEQKGDRGQVESSNEAGDVIISTPKQTESPSDSESSTWKSFKKLMTPKRKVKEDEESKDAAQSDSEATQEETLFSLRKLLPGRKKKQDQLSSDEGDREMVSEDENSETPAVVPLSEFDQSETEDSAKTETEIEESKLESEQEQEHILEIPKTFVQEVQEHQVTPVVALNQDQDELTEFSKYQPLSDIPEEGHITETVATSFIEEVAKDDTIAEDMVEITSEAITAPEPVDITMADETDELMLSAASHLPESSKTSGNATPVPAEYDIKDTDVLLNEVAEMISTVAIAETVYSEESVLERVVSFVTQKTLGRAVSKEQDVMIIHAQSDAVITETELQVDEMQDAATARSESLSEFKDAISTEYVSEVSKLEFESAKADVDEIHLSHPTRPVKQESVDDSEYMIESLSEVPESTDTVLQDYMVQDVVPAECLDGETKEMRTESLQLLLDEKVEAINVLEKERAEIQDPTTSSGPELPKAEVDSVLETCKEEEAIQEDETVDSKGLIDQPGEFVQPSEERTDVQSLEGGAELGKEETQEPSNEQAPEQLQNETERSAEVEIVAEDFEFIKQDVEQEQESALETQNPPIQELVVQEEQLLILSGLAIKEEMIEDEVTEQSEKGIIGELDQDKVEGHISEFNEAIINNVKEPLTEAITEQESGVDNVKEPVTEEQEGGVDNVRVHLTEATTEQDGGDDNVKEPVTEATTEQEGGLDNVKEPVTEATTEQDGGDDHVKEPITEATTEQLKVDGFVISGEVVTTNKLLKQKRDECTEGTVLLADEKIQETEGIAREVALRDGSGELEEQPLPEGTPGDIYDKMEVQETTEDQEQEMLPEEPGVQNALEISEEHTAQVMHLDHRHEVTEDLEALLAVHVSSINEDSGIAQVLEDTVDLEKSSELIVSTIEEPIHAVHIGEIEVKVEGQLEEEIPCPTTELAKVVHATLPEESMATSQQVTTTMPDLILIQRTVEESERISEETSIPFVDNAEVLDEPKNEVNLIQVEEVGIQGEKEEDIVPPVTSNADMQYAFAAQMATCSFSDVATRIPEVSLETTKQIYEPMVGKIASEQEHNEPIETTTPLEVHDVTQAAQQGKTVVLMHVPSVKLEDKHQIQVQMVDVDIQSAETSLDTALEIVVQEDKKVVYTCHETVEKVDSVSAISEIEQEIVSETDNVAIQDVVQHVKEKAPDSEEEPEHKEPPSDLVDDKLSEDHKIILTHDEEDAVAVIQEVMATKDEVLTKMGEEFKDVQKAPTVENQVATPSCTAVAVPQNTGILSSSGNVDAPSCLSLEFKLNIQFGQSRAPILPSPPSTTEKNISSSPPTQSPTVPPVVRSESPKSTEMTEVGVQAVNEESNQKNEQQKTDIITAEAAVQATETTEEPDLVETVDQVLSVGIQSTEIEEPIEEVKATEITQKKTILMDVGTQSTEIAEQAKEKTTEIETIDSQPVLINVGVQSMPQEELSEKAKIKVECPSIQTAEIVQPDKELTKEEVVLTELVVLQVSGDPIKQTEDEDENQDVWMDAEEDIDGQEERTATTLCEIEDSFESQPDYFEETKSDFEESFNTRKKTTLKCDSEEEDFAAALEDPQIATTISTIEWD